MGGFSITALDTIVTPIAHEQFGFETLENSALFAGARQQAVMDAPDVFVVERMSERRALSHHVS